MISKCANPSCLRPFEPRAGKFFQFHVRLGELASINLNAVEHFWLCSHCSLTHTMVNDPESGPTVRLRWDELPESAHAKELLAS